MKKLFAILFLSITFFTNAQEVTYTSKDVDICNTKFEFAAKEKLSQLPINQIMIEIGKTFLGTPYVAHTLEKGDKEHLVIHLSGLDCYTFFESTLTLSRCVKKGKTTFEDFQNELKKIRYRNGEINGYPSRLHYASDWLFDNSKRGIVKDITKEIGGIPFKKKINFMSSNPQYYPQLQKHPEFIKAMKEIEDSINSREYYYIPQDSIENVESKIHSGDIILITASAIGLDISHTGLAIRLDDGRIHFLHAPLAGKKVQITEEPLADYVKKIKRHTGIMVARPLEP